MSNQHGQASRVPTDQGVIVTPLKISFTIHAINQCRSVLQNRVRILIVVARVDFFQKGIKKMLGQATLYNTSTPESALGSKLLRANTDAFALLDIIQFD